MKARRALWSVAVLAPFAACASGASSTSGAGGAGGGGTSSSSASGNATSSASSSTAAASSGSTGAGGHAGAGGQGGGAPVLLPALKNLGQGWQIYPGGGYRYGPSILVHPDQSIDVFTCSPGANGAWDFIRHRRSTDGGHTWTPDVVALQPTPGSKDAYSTCDPGAVMVNGYYYVGYTSTENPKGTANQVYVARATSPDGPYQKWTGSGWGDGPVPIVAYQGDPNAYGAGEPSLVLVGKKLYVFSTDEDGVGSYTDLATVDDATADDWPSKLVAHGHVITRRDGSEDSTDIKWVDALARFVGVSTYHRFGVEATVGVYQSADGMAFEPIPFLGARVQSGAHNIGLSGDESGHVTSSIPLFVAYAYAPPGAAWGDWPTFVDPLAWEMVAKGTPVGGAVSSDLPGAQGYDWSGPKLWDGDPTTVYSSDSHGATAAASESVYIDLGATYHVRGVVLTPRAAGLAFPTDFTIDAATDPSSFTTVPGQTHSAFAPPAGDVTLMFQSPVDARYLRLAATGLGPDDNGNHYLQLAEMKPIVP